MTNFSNAETWKPLIFGSYGRDEIDKAVSYPDWQTLRVKLLGTSLQVKFEHLQDWVATAETDTEFALRKVQVTNYVNALKRGGLIK